MDLLNRLRGVSEDAREPAPGKYVGQSDAGDPNSISPTSWRWPTWTMGDLAKCARGKHLATRQQVVHGWAGGGSEISHFYCACGQWRWLNYNGSWVEEEHMEPGGHERWIDGHRENLAHMAEFQQYRPRR